MGTRRKTENQAKKNNATRLEINRDLKMDRGEADLFPPFFEFSNERGKTTISNAQPNKIRIDLQRSKSMLFLMALETSSSSERG